MLKMDVVNNDLSTDAFGRQYGKGQYPGVRIYIVGDNDGYDNTLNSAMLKFCQNKVIEYVQNDWNNDVYINDMGDVVGKGDERTQSNVQQSSSEMEETRETSELVDFANGIASKEFYKENKNNEYENDYQSFFKAVTEFAQNHANLSDEIYEFVKFVCSNVVRIPQKDRTNLVSEPKVGGKTVNWTTKDKKYVKLPEGLKAFFSSNGKPVESVQANSQAYITQNIQKWVADQSSTNKGDDEYAEEKKGVYSLRAELKKIDEADVMFAHNIRLVDNRIDGKMFIWFPVYLRLEDKFINDEGKKKKRALTAYYIRRVIPHVYKLLQKLINPNELVDDVSKILGNKMADKYLELKKTESFIETIDVNKELSELINKNGLDENDTQFKNLRDKVKITLDKLKAMFSESEIKVLDTVGTYHELIKLGKEEGLKSEDYRKKYEELNTKYADVINNCEQLFSFNNHMLMTIQGLPVGADLRSKTTWFNDGYVLKNGALPYALIRPKFVKRSDIPMKVMYRTDFGKKSHEKTLNKSEFTYNNLKPVQPEMASLDDVHNTYVPGLTFEFSDKTYLVFDYYTAEQVVKEKDVERPYKGVENVIANIDQERYTNNILRSILMLVNKTPKSEYINVSGQLNFQTMSTHDAREGVYKQLVEYVKNTLTKRYYKKKLSVEFDDVSNARFGDDILTQQALACTNIILRSLEVYDTLSDVVEIPRGPFYDESSSNVSATYGNNDDDSENVSVSYSSQAVAEENMFSVAHIVRNAINNIYSSVVRIGKPVNESIYDGIFDKQPIQDDNFIEESITKLFEGYRRKLMSENKNVAEMKRKFDAIMRKFR